MVSIEEEINDIFTSMIEDITVLNKDMDPSLTFDIGRLYILFNMLQRSKEITRVEVIDEEGRSYSKRDIPEGVVNLSYQDEGKTLKVFLDSDKRI